jgi:hypothetical protein
MSYLAIVEMVIKQGVDNVAVPESLRPQVLTEVSRRLLHIHKYEEAGKALALAGNPNAVLKAADWFFNQGLYWEAACFLVHTQENDQINRCAIELVNAGKLKEARHMFLTTKNTEMLQFIRQNFDL